MLSPEELVRLSGVGKGNAVIFSGSISRISGTLRFGRK